MSKKKLYHGTRKIFKNSIINGINLDAGRLNLDFGHGFYMTSDLGQAIKWANRLDDPCVLEFILDTAELNTKEFCVPDIEWARFVVSNRLGMPVKQYDVVSGPMADTGISKISRQFRKGIITFDIAVKSLVGNTNGCQVTVLTKKAINYLTFEREVELI